VRALERRVHRDRLRALLATLVVVVGVGVAAHAAGQARGHSPTPAELRDRAQRGLTAVVEGRAYLERARPDAPDEPLAGVSIALLPSSPALLERLAAVKRESRESMQGFRDGAPAVRHLIESQEGELWSSGYPDAAIRTGTDEAGRFRVEVPAGPWVLIAMRRVFVTTDRTARDTPARSATALDPLARYAASQYQHFLPSARMTGFDAVSVWLREVEAESRQRVELELHDRGVWLSGVEEEVTVPRRLKFGGGGLRRP
jgi:hypothetical protein